MIRVIEALKTGRQLIEKYGWVTGSWGSVHSGFCALGAVNTALTGGAIPDRVANVMPAWDALLLALPEENHGYSVADYNDEPGRTVDDIYALYDRAIQKLEAEQ